MAFKFILVAFCGFVVVAKASMVELHSEWKPNLGWEVTCNWRLFANDSLQSVRLSNNEMQFMIYRPETEGPRRTQLFRIPENVLQVDCYETSEKGITGKCVMTLELFQPMKLDSTHTCEVSGERPFFRIETKSIVVEALVPPSPAIVEPTQMDKTSGRVVLNCTSSGMPPPNLIWTIGDQRIPHEFSGSTWNVTSKLYHVWSSISYSPIQTNLNAKCTPESSKDGQLIRAEAMEYNSSNIVKEKTCIVGVLLFLLHLTR